MTPRARLSIDIVTAAAIEVVDEFGFEALSLSVVAEALGVGPSALYSHVDGLEGLRRVVAVRSTRLLTDAVRDAAIGNAGDDAVRAVAVAYRGFVRRHPGRFAATLRIEALHMEGADDDLQGVFVLLLRTRRGNDDEARLAARSLRSALHGFLALEQNAGVAAGSDDEFGHLIDTLCRGLAR